MTRAGRKDRGLLQRVDATGKPMWYVRFWHEGRERRFGRFPTKTKAREFYEKAKLEQKEGRFFPERYQCGGYDLVSDFLKAHVTQRTHRRDQRSEKGFLTWWAQYFKDKRLNAITPEALEHARRQLLTLDYIVKRQQTNASAGTIRREWQVLMRLLNLAVPYDSVDKNRLKVVELPDADRRSRVASPQGLEAI